MNRPLNILINRREIFLAIIFGALIAFLSIFPPITILYVIIGLYIWPYVRYYKNSYNLIDVPFLLFIVGTFAFGRA